MRIGVIGPGRLSAHEAPDRGALREAVEFLLGDVEVDFALYLGAGGQDLERELAEWTSELLGISGGRDQLFERTTQLAIHGSPDAIDAFLAADARAHSFRRVRTLPPAPTRAIELVADRIVVAVYDKSILDEEDVANAQLILYGKSAEANLKRFGTRYFLTPGPLAAERVAVIEQEEEGNVSLSLFETTGVPVWRETMSHRSTKVSIAQ